MKQITRNRGVCDCEDLLQRHVYARQSKMPELIDSTIMYRPNSVRYRILRIKKN